MASIEFIQKRIEGKEKEIVKLEKKMERIRKAEASNWENNPYWYSERDLQYTEKDLASARQALDEYKAQLQAENEKANSRNIPAILDFLDMWKERVTEYYHKEFAKFIEARKEWRVAERANCDWHNHGAWQMRKDNPEEYNRIEKEYKQRRKEYMARWNFIFEYVDRNDFNDAKLAKDLKRDADAKYDFIIERTNAIVGQITDATNLHIGNKGDLNGFIIGNKGTAKVETIGAGGYNIQCYHFRTLINKIK